MRLFDLLRDRIEIIHLRREHARLVREKALLQEELRIKNTLWDQIDALSSDAPDLQPCSKKPRGKKTPGRKLRAKNARSGKGHGRK